MARLWAEAAAVCFDEVGHREKVIMLIRGLPAATRVRVRPPAVDDAMRRTHRNFKEATEYGAISVVACLVQALTDYVFLEQAFDHTGVDYWLADRDDDGPLFQGQIRLEISGILRETSSNTIQYRIEQKRDRLGKYPSEHPAKIAVVEFASPRTVVEDHG